MRRKLLIGGLGVVAAVFTPTALGSGGGLQALDCPVGQVAAACDAVNLVYTTACFQPLPEVPSIGGVVTVDLEGGAPLVCPEI